MLKTPILFLIFNRPNNTREVFEAIRRAKPTHLFIAADGPREHRPKDQKKCKITREITENIDWDCTVERLYREENLGCREAVSSALNWFFGNVEEGIILEDDCLPHPSFFSFCEKLLNKYRDTKEVMHISGNNFLHGEITIKNDYYFSRIPDIWGWATWRDRWELYDHTMSTFDTFVKEQKLKKIFPKWFYQKTWLNLLKRARAQTDAWGYNWTYTVFDNQGFCINPSKNLVTNIGFSSEATHTSTVDPYTSYIPSHELTLEQHPPVIKAHIKADELTMQNCFGMKPSNVIKNKMRQLTKLLR